LMNYAPILTACKAELKGWKNTCSLPGIINATL
jgi:hypothetical protein